MKLGLKHLAPYLPYKLKGKLENEDCYPTTIGELYRLETSADSDMIPYCIVDVYEGEIVDFKPILRNLSDLTKEIEVNGEKFVPLQKLCRMIAYNEQYHKNWNYYKDEKYVSNGTQFGTFEKELVYYATASDSIMSREFGYFSKSKRFYLKNNRDEIDLTYAVNQFLGLEKMIEWHFDVFGLIEKGLAIDINSLED